MAAHHVNKQQIKHHYLKDEIEPWCIDNHRNKADKDACVEGEDVSVFHQWQTQRAEVVTEILWGDPILAIALIQHCTQALHVGCVTLLVARVTTIEEQNQLAPEVPAPLQLMVLLIKFGAAVKLALRHEYLESVF